MELQEVERFPYPLLVASNGYGNGDGDGDGDGHGHGHGHGNGDGDGYGHEYGVSSINGKQIYIIDGVQTILESIKNDVAKGFILNNDLSLEPCFVVRNEWHYSHGKSLKEALQSLNEKTLLSLPIPQRVENFKRKFPDYAKKQKASLLYDWHFLLTGSCKMGRDSFLLNHNIDLKKDKFTVNEFISLTENSYSGEIIKKLHKL